MLQNSQSRVTGIAVAVMFSLLLMGCAGTTEHPDGGNTQRPTIETVDFTELEWSLAHLGRMVPTDGLRFDDGVATIESVEYSIDVAGILFSDADQDGDLDALVPVTMVDLSKKRADVGTAWYLWSDEDGTPVQLRIPAALNHCEIVVHAVTAVPGGFEFDESHLRSGEESYTACGDPGSDTRTRTVAIIADGPNGEYWPVQTAPFASFGGVCPISISFHTDPVSDELFSTPNAAAPPLRGNELRIWALQDWPIYQSSYPGWSLVGVVDAGAASCAWLAHR